jgi:hypothetical protein
MIERTRIQELIKVFYQQPFKIFYVNSIDGETFIKPTGLFVSLGLSTPMKTIEGLRNVISNTYPESSPKIVELCSKNVMGGDQYLNTITDNLDPQPYVIDEFPQGSLDKNQAEEELKKLREKIKESKETELLASTQKLQELIDRLSQGDGWENHRIVKIGTDYKTFHKVANYKKQGDLEYRVGIYVE